MALILQLLPGIYAGELFPWHPVLMGVGFLGFMCEGVLAAYKLRSTDGPPRVMAITNHMYVQLAATLSIILGFLAIYYNKVRHGVGCRWKDALPQLRRMPSLPAASLMGGSLPPMQALHGKSHFTSFHGKVGVLVMALVAAAPALGFLSFRKMGLLTRLPAEQQSRVKWAHRLVSADAMHAAWHRPCRMRRVPLVQARAHSRSYRSLCCSWGLLRGL